MAKRAGDFSHLCARSQPYDNEWVRTISKKAASRTFHTCLAVFALLLLICGCARKQSSEANHPNVDASEEVRPEEALKPLTLAPVDVERPQPEHFLHKEFSVKNHAEFSFLVPAHQPNTRLRGTFRSFAKPGAPDSTSDQTTDVKLLLLNDQEFNEFQHGEPQSVTYELDPSHDQIVEWRVPTTFSDPQTYHLVFSNPPGGLKTKFVEADFTVSFE
jgi:hypothetical protein